LLTRFILIGMFNSKDRVVKRINGEKLDLTPFILVETEIAKGLPLWEHIAATEGDTLQDKRELMHVDGKIVSRKEIRERSAISTDERMDEFIKKACPKK